MTAPPSASLPLLSLSGGVATITLNRPAHRNRLENPDLVTLLQHFAQVDADPSVRVLVVTANTQGHTRPVFCAGYDIGGFDSASAAPAFEDIPNTLARLRPVTICALNGSVYGGATDLVLACDLRVALEGIEWRMPATAFGLHYYPSGLERYVNRLGVSATKRAFLTGRPLSAQALWATGCLEALVDRSLFDSTVSALVRDVAALAPLAAQTTKQSLNDIAEGRWDMAQLRARETLTAQSQDFAEGRRAFAEKRIPRFVGR